MQLITQSQAVEEEIKKLARAICHYQQEIVLGYVLADLMWFRWQAVRNLAIASIWILSLSSWAGSCGIIMTDDTGPSGQTSGWGFLGFLALIVGGGIGLIGAINFLLNTGRATIRVTPSGSIVLSTTGAPVDLNRYTLLQAGIDPVKLLRQLRDQTHKLEINLQAGLQYKPGVHHDAQGALSLVERE